MTVASGAASGVRPPHIKSVPSNFMFGPPVIAYIQNFISKMCPPCCEILAAGLTAWREATSRCFGRPCCFGHRQIFHLISKNENSNTDLCI